MGGSRVAFRTSRPRLFLNELFTMKEILFLLQISPKHRQICLLAAFKRNFIFVTKFTVRIEKSKMSDRFLEFLLKLGPHILFLNFYHTFAKRNLISF